jgi:prepilin peptidase CpaA
MYPLIQDRVVEVLVVLLMVVAAVYDIRFRRIPNRLVFPALLAGFVVNAGFGGWAGGWSGFWAGLGHAGLGFAVAVAVYMPLYALHGMGGGDVKLAAALGAFVGWRLWVGILIFTGLIGGVLAVLLLIKSGRFRKTVRNTVYILWEMVHMRAPHQRNRDLDIASPTAFTLPHGAVMALGTLTLVGLRVFRVGG